MEILKFTIEGSLPNLNQIIDIAKLKRNKYAAYRKLKSDYDFIVKASCPNVSFIISHINHMHIHWVSVNRRIDKDNIRAGIKFILDGMQGKLLTQDGYNNIGTFSDSFSIDKEKPRIEVTIYFKKENTHERG